MAKTTNGKRQRKQKKLPGERANDAAKCEAAAVGGMTRRERRKLYADITRISRDLAAYAPTMEVVKGDPLKALMLIGAEFVARYYPGASSATFHITKYPSTGGSPEFSVMIPMPVPAAVANGSAGPT